MSELKETKKVKVVQVHVVVEPYHNPKNSPSESRKSKKMAPKLKQNQRSEFKET